MQLRTTIIIFLLCNCCCINFVYAVDPGYICTDDFDCIEDDKNLMCDISLGICTCQVGAQYDWLGEDKCQLLVGQSCRDPNHEIAIIPNALCDASTNFLVRCKPGFPETRGTRRCAMSYNGVCDPDLRDCNEYAYQQCISGSSGRGNCGCKDDSIFDGEKCVLKATQICTSPPPEFWKLVPQECSALSNCIDNRIEGTCQCNLNLTPNKNGLCKVMQDGRCDYSGSLPCDDAKFLSCINSKCSCAAGAFYEEAKESCVIQANRQCNPLGPQQCVQYSDCMLEREGNGAGNYFCKCWDGSVENQNKQCVRPFGADCGVTGDPPCDEDAHQTCSGYQCSCKNPADSFYDPQTKTCFLTAGARCTANEMPCIANAECLSGVCYCKDGLRPNGEGKCVLNHGAPCNVNNPLCDPLTYLTCNGNTSTCGCASEDALFDGTTCKLKANAQCDPTPGKQSCVELAQCNEISGTCQCKSPNPVDSDLITNPVGMCVRKYGAKCNIEGETAGTCDKDYGFQTCNQDNNCVCLEPDNMKYNATDGRCYGLKDKPCTGEVPCETGLACSASNICACDSSMGLVEDEFGDCVRTPGSTCDNADPFGKCNEKAYMSCVSNVCQCNDGYNQTGQGLNAKCVGNYNAPCSTHANCNVNGSLICNTNNKCDCAGLGEQEYDRKTQHCWSMIFGRCHISRDYIDEGEVPLECSEELHLTCRRIAENDGGNFGICRCADKYAEVYNVCTSGGPKGIFTGVTLMTVFISVIVIIVSV